ncbi:DUF1326 domain-containing protein [Arthrobacter bambusae]|jgi:hypothetical protein|uniref:DUF1326 domain-containing protein n=1 Tax=Arthrobacter TaxID=1663 RepID=UPI001F505BD0|nr:MULTISPECIES: DUF1326 domain-containing protein [Arthrobacter]MCI0141907.1 DUF1326 domain-containing protein [Arthrobacter bambusae]UYY83315.1 DUF1326 domain-containing protein [Arthrobacter sp. YA7-1]
MSWHVEGTYFENCNCDMVCPCSTSGLTAPADNDRCNVALAFHVDSGEVNGVDVGGLTVCVVADTPALMSDGGWKIGVLMDAAASPEQAEALGGVFGGQLGGPMEGLTPLIGEMAGMESLEMAYTEDGRSHQVRIGSAVDMAVEDFVSPLDATGLGVKVSGIGFPADTLAAGTASTARVDVFGMTWDNAGKNSFSAPFAWSA